MMPSPKTCSRHINRPALQKLLSDCESGLIDIIITYRLDRLSRSITDFADLTKKFDEWGVQFVSVTQEINTATSAGRMMLNILITFAQYEREVVMEPFFLRSAAVVSRKSPLPYAEYSRGRISKEAAGSSPSG